MIMAETKNNKEEMFYDLENRWMNAWKNQDEKTVRELIADDFTLTSSLSQGELMTKEQWIGALPNYVCHGFNFDKIKVRLHGNTAILNIWYHQEATVNGKEWNGNFLMTDIWVNQQNDQWQVLARHSTWLKEN